MLLVSKRARTDFYTNPCYNDLVTMLHEMKRSHTESIKAAGRDGDYTKMTLRTGIVDGIDLCIMRMENERKDATEPQLEEANEPI